MPSLQILSDFQLPNRSCWAQDIIKIYTADVANVLPGLVNPNFRIYLPLIIEVDSESDSTTSVRVRKNFQAVR